MSSISLNGFRRLLLLVFILLPLCACAAENPEIDEKEKAVGDAFNEETIPSQSNGAASQIPEETMERADTSSPLPVIKPDPKATAPAEKESIGNYTLVKGEKYPICREFLENLNYFKGKGETPMAYDLRIDSQFKNFRTLNWEEMPIDEEFLKNLFYDRYPSQPNTRDASWKRFYSDFLGEHKLPFKELSLYKAPVQIFRDGRKNFVLRFIRNNVPKKAGEVTDELFILNNNLRIDPESFPFSQGAGQSGGDLFYYDGKIRNFLTMFDSYDPVSKRRPAIVRLYDIIEYKESAGLFRQEICVYTYTY